MRFKDILGLFFVITFAKFNENGAVRCRRNDFVIWVLNNILKLDPDTFTKTIKEYVDANL